MRMTMLKEGHRDQVAMMQKNTLVRLFLPMDLETAMILMSRGLDSRVGGQKEVSGIGVLPTMEVEYYLQDAIQEGTIVVQVWIKGKHLYPGSTTSRYEYIAANKYSDSFNPTVSMALLDRDRDTEVLFNGQLDAADVVKVYLVGYDPEGYRLTGNHKITAEYSPEEFLNWYAGFKSRQAQIRSGTEKGSSRDPKRVMGRLRQPKGWAAADD